MVRLRIRGVFISGDRGDGVDRVIFPYGMTASLESVIESAPRSESLSIISSTRSICSGCSLSNGEAEEALRITSGHSSSFPMSVMDVG